jgi:hypothetical protein
VSHLIKRHPLPVKSFLRRSLVLAYSVPQELVQPLLHPGLELDTFKGHGFFVVAMVQSERLRPAFLPSTLGTSFFLAGYRLFVRYRTLGGKTLRGLQILGTETDRPLMVAAGNLLTHYQYGLVRADVVAEGSSLSVKVVRDGAVTLDVEADLGAHELPEGSIFNTPAEARRFAGPMPFTFDYERETHSIVRVQGRHENWDPVPVRTRIDVHPDFSRFGIPSEPPAPASAFYLEGVPYRWDKGIVERLP